MPTINDPVDLLLDDNGDLVITTDLQFSKGIAAVAQGIMLRVTTFRGEWFLNLDEGVPYYQSILGQKFDQPKIHAAIRKAILNAPGILSIASLTASFNGSKRVLMVAWSANTIFGLVSGSAVI